MRACTALTSTVSCIRAKVGGVSVPVTEAEVEDGDVDTLAIRLANSATEDGCGEPLSDRKVARILVDSLGVFL